MKTSNRSQAFLKKRRLMLVLPLVVLPFITMAFWALGGGRRGGDIKEGKTGGLNLNLPSSNVTDKNAGNKLSFYDKAQKDSIKLEEWMRNDPYYKNYPDTSLSAPANELERLTANTATRYNQRLNASPYESSDGAAEQKLMQKLALLQAELAKPKQKMEKKASDTDDFGIGTERQEDITENKGSEEGEDLEMKQLGNTLDKILDIQHPQRIKERLKVKSAQTKGIVFRVNKTQDEKSSSLLGAKDEEKNNGLSRFYGLTIYGDTTADNAIEAAAHAEQTLVDGSVVQFRLLTDVFINGKLLSYGTLVNGIAALNGERLLVEIVGMRSGNSLFPVKLSVYDMDGLPGIYIPGAISRDVAQQQSDNGLQLLELSTMNPSLKAQVASAGINAAKSIIGKKVKQVKVTVKAGYKVLLKNSLDQD